MSDPLAGGQAQEKGERGCEQGAGRLPEDDRPRESSGRGTMQDWRVSPISATLNRLKERETRGVRLTLLQSGSIKHDCACVYLAQIITAALRME